MGEAALDALLHRIETEVRPLLDLGKYEGGYDCCGCTTYDRIVDDVVRIIREERGGV